MATSRKANGYKIERGVPTPPARRGSLYPFAQMDVGDSFVVPLGATAFAARQAAYDYSTGGAKRGRKFSCRKQDDGTLRIWRVA